MSGRLRESYTIIDKYGLDPLSDIRDRAVLEITDINTFTLNQAYAGRPELIALDYFSDENLWWVVLLFNGTITYHDIVGGMEMVLPKQIALSTVLSNLPIEKSIINTNDTYI